MRARAFVIVAAGLVPLPLLGQTADSVPSDSAAARWSAARTVSEYLLGRLPGVLVYPSSGTTGAGARIRIRGSSSLLASNEPVVYLDGVRIDAAESALTINVGGQAPSRLNDLNLDDIDSIQVVRGPAAGVRYGAEAAHGVLLLYSKRGRAGPTRFHAYVEEGRLSEPTRWAANWGGVDLDNPSPFYADGACTLQDEATGACTQDFLRAFAPLESRSQFAAGARRQHGLRFSGGAADARFALAVERETDGGAYELSESEAERLLGLYGRIREHTRHPNTLGRTSVTGNVEWAIGPRADVALSLLSVSSELRLPFNDNHIYGLLGSGLRGSSDSTVNDGWREPFRPGELFQVLSSQILDRRVASLRVALRPIAFLTLEAVAGLDDMEQDDFQLQRYGEGPGFGDGGTVSDNRVDGRRRTLGLTATGTFAATSTLRGSTRVGMRHVRRESDELLLLGSNLPPGATSVSAAANQSGRQRRRKDDRLSVFIEQELAWHDRLTVTGGLRRDDDSTPGGATASSPATWSPALALGWRSRGRIGGPFGALELRAGYGSASAPSGIYGTGAERMREVELAAGSALASGRGAVRVVAYDQRSTDVVEFHWLSPSPGIIHSVPANGAAVANRGVELQLEARVVDRAALAWDVGLTAWGNRNRDRKSVV